MTNFSTTLPLYGPVHILDDPLPLPQLRTYLMNGLFFNQKKIRTFEYRIQLNINIQKKKILYEKINDSVE